MSTAALVAGVILIILGLIMIGLGVWGNTTTTSTTMTTVIPAGPTTGTTVNWWWVAIGVLMLIIGIAVIMWGHSNKNTTIHHHEDYTHTGYHPDMGSSPYDTGYDPLGSHSGPPMATNPYGSVYA